MIFLHCTKAFSLSITASNLALNTFVMILYTIPKRLKGLKFLSRIAKFFLEIKVMIMNVALRLDEMEVSVCSPV